MQIISFRDSGATCYRNRHLNTVNFDDPKGGNQEHFQFAKNSKCNVKNNLFSNPIGFINLINFMVVLVNVRNWKSLTVTAVRESCRFEENVHIVK